MQNSVIEVKAIAVKKIEEEKAIIKSLVDRAEGVQVSTQEEATNASGFIRQIKNKWKERNDERKKISVPIDIAKKALPSLFMPGLNALANAETIIKNKMLDYEDNQAEIRRKAEEKLRKQAEAEEKRKREALEARAKKAEEKGNTEKAEELREQKEEVQVTAPTLAPAPKTEGISYIEKYKGEVTDFSKLSDKFKVVNQSAINAVGQQTKGQQPEPGIRWVMYKEIRSR